MLCTVCVCVCVHYVLKNCLYGHDYSTFSQSMHVYGLCLQYSMHECPCIELLMHNFFHL